jgi:predicted nuclease with TOPRIM domain
MIRAGFCLMLCAATALAQNQPTQEQLQKAYDEALVQLKAAQDRKNELASENQKLQQRLTEVEAQTQTLQEQIFTLQNRSYFLREHHAAWRAFLDANPSVNAMWLTYFNGIPAAFTLSDILGDGRWPFSYTG